MLGKQYTHETHKELLKKKQYYKAFWSLYPDQLVGVVFNCHWCKRAVAALRNGESFSVYYLFLSKPWWHREVPCHQNIIQGRQPPL